MVATLRRSGIFDSEDDATVFAIQLAQRMEKGWHLGSGAEHAGEDASQLAEKQADVDQGAGAEHAGEGACEDLAIGAIAIQ